MKKLRLLTLATAIIILLCSCASMLSREYFISTPHDEQYETDVDSEALTADNYYGMKNAILYFVEEGIENGVIRLYNYVGNVDVETDLADAALEVMMDPLGAYAVNYMTPSHSRIVSYYELRININFRKTADEIAEIVRAGSTSELEQVLTGAMERFDDSLVVRMSYYSDTDIDAMIENIYNTTPLVAFGVPAVSINLYPSTGIQRIAEINFEYGYSAGELLIMQEKLAGAIKNYSGIANYITSIPLRAYKLYHRIVGLTEYDFYSADILMNEGALDDSSLAVTVYGAFIEKLAVAEGIAKAYKQLCDLCGIECQIVSGRKNNESHTWNIVTIDGQSYHVDCSAELISPDDICFFRSDDDMTLYQYRWNRDNYPECNGPLTYYDVNPAAIPDSVEASVEIADNGDEQLPAPGADNATDPFNPAVSPEPLPQADEPSDVEPSESEPLEQPDDELQGQSPETNPPDDVTEPPDMSADDEILDNPGENASPGTGADGEVL